MKTQCPTCHGRGYVEVDPGPQNAEDVRIHGVLGPQAYPCFDCDETGEVSRRWMDRYDDAQEASCEPQN